MPPPAHFDVIDCPLTRHTQIDDGMRTEDAIVAR
jgi:hypothetical protein